MELYVRPGRYTSGTIEGSGSMWKLGGNVTRTRPRLAVLKYKIYQDVLMGFGFCSRVLCCRQFAATDFVCIPCEAASSAALLYCHTLG